MKKQYYILIFFLLIGFVAFARKKKGNSNFLTMKKDNKFSPLNNTNKFRECDVFGCGYFGASRGNHSHRGLDIEVSENQTIQAPFDCKIVRYGYPYANNTDYKLVEIQGINSFSNYTAKIMYIKKTLPVGKIINKGNAICKADNIAKKYGNGMTNHVHFELYKNGTLVDPAPYFKKNNS